jgi:hypothetical protein
MIMIVAPDRAGSRHKSRQSCRNTGQVFAFATIRLRRHQNVSLGRCGFRMLRFSTVFALLVIGLPAAAQEGRNDFPPYYTAGMDTASSKVERMAGCFAPQRCLAFSLRNSDKRFRVFSSSRMGCECGRSRYLPAAGTGMDRGVRIYS